MLKCLLHRGQIKRQLGDVSGALADFAACISMQKSDPRSYKSPQLAAFAERRSLLMQQRRYAEAVKHFDEHLKIKPNAVADHVDRGFCLLKLKRYDEAIAGFGRALELDKKNVLALSNRSVCYLMTERYALAKNDIDAALRIDPGHRFALLNYGEVEYVNGHYAAARGVWLRLIRARPRLLAGHVRYVLLLAACPDPAFRDGAAALKHVREFADKVGWTSPVALRVLAAAHAEAGNFQEAVRLQKKAVRPASHPSSSSRDAALLRIYSAGRPHRLPAGKPTMLFLQSD